MEYKKFIISNYRAITETVVTLNGNLLPIIGVNESGKSSVLQAILSFDKRKDDYIIEKSGGEHLDYKRRQGLRCLTIHGIAGSYNSRQTQRVCV